MKAIVYPEFGQLIFRDWPLPAIKENEVLLKVSACGICGSELETFRQKSSRRLPPLIMGHEFCGTIVKAGNEVSEFMVGEHVVSNSIVSCGNCVHCKQGETNLCLKREVFGIHRGGAFAEFVNVPVHCLILMPGGLSPQKACLAEPLANGVHMVNLTKHIIPKRVLVIGAGSIGLLAQQSFQFMKGSVTIVADVKEERLHVAKKLGATSIINPREIDLVEAIMSLTDNQGVDIVIDAVGTKVTNMQSLKSVRPGGALVMIGLHENSRSLESYEIILQEKQVLGSYAARMEDIREALQLMHTGKVDVDSWVNYYSLEEGEKAFKEMLTGEGNHIKSVILPAQ